MRGTSLPGPVLYCTLSQNLARVLGWETKGFSCPGPVQALSFSLKSIFFRESLSEIDMSAASPRGRPLSSHCEPLVVAPPSTSPPLLFWPPTCAPCLWKRALAPLQIRAVLSAPHFRSACLRPTAPSPPPFPFSPLPFPTPPGPASPSPVGASGTPRPAPGLPFPCSAVSLPIALLPTAPAPPPGSGAPVVSPPPCALMLGLQPCVPAWHRNADAPEGRGARQSSVPCARQANERAGRLLGWWRVMWRVDSSSGTFARVQ